MNLGRLLEIFLTNPNSSKGLIMRAEMLEEDSKDQTSELKVTYHLYARGLRMIAEKKLSVQENKKQVKELRGLATRE